VHLEQVVKNLGLIGVTDEDVLRAGWLHDTIEDTDTDYDKLKELFAQKVADMVATVTKNKGAARKRA